MVESSMIVLSEVKICCAPREMTATNLTSIPDHKHQHDCLHYHQDNNLRDYHDYVHHYEFTTTTISTCNYHDRNHYHQNNHNRNHHDFDHYHQAPRPPL